jgi:type IV pilus assembly protein PilW
MVPAGFPAAQTHDLQIHAYYVSSQSSLGDDVPSLRRHALMAGGILQDQEVIPGVEDLQVQYGMDTDNDGTVERYVDADHDLLTVGAPGFIPGARVMAVRLWLLLRAVQAEVGFVDDRQYAYADVAAFTPNDGLRRLLVTRTILLRNQRG